MLTEDPIANRTIELEFSRWSNAIGLAEKLRTMKLACCGDGEAFGIMTSNPSIQTPVQLDLMLVEADQVTTPFGVNGLSNYIDRIQFDSFGNPVYYHVLESHPGDTGSAWGEFETVATSAMLHLFRVDRPGQVRGIPEITPALPLFAQLRRFTLAVISAAETAADFAGILYTDSPANGEADAAEPFEPIELEKRTLVTMPGGWKMSQIHAEQPTTSYAEFKHEILNEIARCSIAFYQRGSAKPFSSKACCLNPFEQQTSTPRINGSLMDTSMSIR
jgi:capsid protein